MRLGILYSACGCGDILSGKGHRTHAMAGFDCNKYASVKTRQHRSGKVLSGLDVTMIFSGRLWYIFNDTSIDSLTLDNYIYVLCHACSTTIDLYKVSDYLVINTSPTAMDFPLYTLKYACLPRLEKWMKSSRQFTKWTCVAEVNQRMQVRSARHNVWKEVNDDRCQQ